MCGGGDLQSGIVAAAQRKMASKTHYKDIVDSSSESLKGQPWPDVSVTCENPGLSSPEPRSGPSLGDISITQQKSSGENRLKLIGLGICPDSSWLVGGCSHGAVRWLRLPCKRRDCPVCGLHRKRRIAWRIAHGIEVLGGDHGAAWMTGTWAEDVTKAEANKTVAKFIRWLREGHGQYKEVKRRRIAAFKRREGRNPTKDEKRVIGDRVRESLSRTIEYASTWELQKRGVLHVNLILAPWKYIPKAMLQEAWQRFGGGNVWIERVGCEVGVEAAKVNGVTMTAEESRQQIANYLGKWDQMVMSGRGVCYSRGWPELPVESVGVREGEITWGWFHGASDQARVLWYGQQMGDVIEVAPGEYAHSEGEPCRCFNRVHEKVSETRHPPDRLGPDDLQGAQEWLESVKTAARYAAESRPEFAMQTSLWEVV